MNHPGPGGEIKAVAIATADDLRERIRKKSRLKGRQPDDVSLAQVRLLIGPPPHRRDLLIENLHKLNDAYRGLHERHLVALAREMNLPMAEVYEVATFYHHFEVVRDGGAAPGLTVRVCDGLACELAGAGDLLTRLPGILGAGVRVIGAPCIGRCEQAPAVAVHQQAVALATPEKVRAAVDHEQKVPPAPMERGLSAINFVAKDFAEKPVSPPRWSTAKRPPSTSSRPWKTPACAAWAARVSRRGASGASSGTSRRPS